MVAPHMLQAPAVKAWLGGIEPVWTLLDQASVDALFLPPAVPGSVLRLAADLTVDDIQQSAMASRMMILLSRAAEAPGLKLTAAGNLSRSVVTEMIDRFAWPGFDTKEAFRLYKVVNEPDFLPLLFLRQIAEVAGLLERWEGHLVTSKVGYGAINEANLPALQAMLFHVTMWHVDLRDFGRGIHNGWPQGDIGVVLWSLSLTANDWETPERLTRLCTIPINSIVSQPWDSGTIAMEGRMLRTLCWFGLLEHREEPIEGSRSGTRRLYRKTRLFDRFLKFDVRLEGSGAVRH